jgi:ABC-type phosphate transport system substrate-binding protein
MSKLKILMGATALVSATAAIAGGVNAQVSTYLYGAGSSLAAPYLRQAFDCFGSATPLVIKGTALNNPTYANPPVAYFDYMGAKATQNCAPSAHQEINATIQGDYESTGSGTGLKAYMSNSPSTYVGDFVPGQDPSPYPAYSFAASETAFSAADVTAYNNGGTDPTTGITLGPPPALFPTPAPLYGPMIQVPLLIAPVTLSYSAEYGRFRAADGTIHHYFFHIKKPRADGSGGLVLDAATYCAIFNGQITDWNQIPVSLNGGLSLQSLQDKADHHAFSVPLVLVGRSDSSGTTSVFTRHMAAQCPLVISGTVYSDSTSTLPASLVAATWVDTNPNYGAGSGVTDVPGKFTVASGSGGVADYLYFDPNNVPAAATGSEVEQGRIGYIGPDYVLPAVLNTGNNTFGLNTASLERPGTTVAITPTAKVAALAYNGLNPPSGANKSAPDQWVQAASKTAPIAIPSDISAYPIVGTSNYVGYTCYDDAARAGTSAAVQSFFKWYWTAETINDPIHGLLAAAGLAPMPKVWVTAINTEFFNPTASTRSDDLWTTFAGNNNAPQCKPITPGA